jgi:hypothetical protein
VLDLDSVGGGLRPDELVGGMQTIGLRFKGRDGLAYEFRSVVKDARKTLPDWLRVGFVMSALDDQMAAQFPLGAVAVADLAEAAGIVEPVVVPVVMPNDPRLGEFRALFAGRVGLFALKVDEADDGRPGFGGFTRVLDDDDLEEALAADTALAFDARHYLRVRYLDMLIGDWDRHEGQWNWAVVEDSTGSSYRAIPEDRDWAFARIDGVLPALVRRVRMQRYVGFDDTFPPVAALAQASAALDRRILGDLELDAFLAVAAEVRTAITDSVIDRALSRLPTAYAEQERERTGAALRRRRDALDALARDFHAFVTVR